ncbi:hypothetical protein [Kribbella karoonensis]|uniref:Uncharacterized protein n=1 Tax=Kribbella karoonensis TaxID=324851 RepID=A0ABN2CXV5_9ACTN
MTQFVIFVVVMIVLSLITKARQQSSRGNGNAKQNARMQAMVQKIQAQQGGNQPIQFQGQFTQAAGPGGPPPAPSAGQSSFPAQAGNPQGSQQAAAILQQLLQNGRQPARPGEWAPPGQTPAQPVAPYQAPGQFQRAQYPLQYNPTQYNPAQYNPAPYQPPAHRPPQNNLPSTKQDLDARVRELMNAGNEVGAVRLLGEERGLGLLEAQQYARSLVTPQTSAASGTAEKPDEPDEDDGRYVGSAAFAESIFNLDDRDENVWASGWVDTPEPDDRSDIDELWQTVSNPPRPTPPTAQ